MGLQRSYPSYDDQQGLYVTALTGVTVTTLKQVRTTGIPMYHATSGDVIIWQVFIYITYLLFHVTGISLLLTHGDGSITGQKYRTHCQIPAR
jgi:hypothetical protein